MVQFDMTSFTKCLTSLRMESVTVQEISGLDLVDLQMRVVSSSTKCR